MIEAHRGSPGFDAAGRVRVLSRLLGLGLVLASACSESGPRRDATVDRGSASDLGRDAGPGDIRLDSGSLDRGPDRAVSDGGSDSREAGADLETPDSRGWDLGLPEASVLYAVTPKTTEFSLRTVPTDGSGSPAAKSGWSGLYSLETLQVAGLSDYLPIRMDRPRRLDAVQTGFSGVRLPGSLGTLHYFHSKLAGTSGLMLVKPTGTIQVLLQVSGLYSDTLGTHVGLRSDGKLGAVVAQTAKVHLFRTDGTTFSSGLSTVDVTPTASPPKSVAPESLTLAGGYLFAVGTDTSGKDLLLRAPEDGSSPLAPLSLPQSGGLPASAIGRELVVDTAGATLVAAAGQMSTVQDLYLVDIKAGTAINLTAGPGLISGRGSTFGLTSGQLALSPSSKLIAYIKYISGLPELFVISTKAGSQPVQVTSSARFADTVSSLFNFYFADDDNLLFMAGENYYNLDLYRWDHASQKAHNLSGSGGLTQPFDGQGDFYPQGAWASPSGSWYYWIGYEYYSKPVSLMNIMGVSLKTFTHKAITTGARVGSGADVFASCPSGMVFFASEEKGGSNSQEVFAFDQTSGQAAKRVTNMTQGTGAYWSVGSLTPGPGCTRLAFSAGGGYTLRLLWQMTAAKPYSESALTSIPQYLAPTIAFSPSGLGLVFASGSGPSQSTLKAASLIGGSATLDSTGGYVQIFAVY